MFILLSIMAIILLCCIVYKYGGRQINEVKNKEIVEVFSKITQKIVSKAKVIYQRLVLKQKNKKIQKSKLMGMKL